MEHYVPHLNQDIMKTHEDALGVSEHTSIGIARLYDFDQLENSVESTVLTKANL